MSAGRKVAPGRGRAPVPRMTLRRAPPACRGLAIARSGRRVAVEVVQRGRAGVDVRAGALDRSGERVQRPGAVAQQDRDLAAVEAEDRDVLAAVPVEVARRQLGRRRGRRPAAARLAEAAAPVAEQHGRRVPREDGEVGVAIPVEARRRGPAELPAGLHDGPAREAAAPVAEEDRDVPCRAGGHGDVGRPVAVEVADGRAHRHPEPQRAPGRGREAARAVAQQDRELAAPGARRAHRGAEPCAHQEVLRAVAVEVGHLGPEGEGRAAPAARRASAGSRPGRRRRAR